MVFEYNGFNRFAGFVVFLELEGLNTHFSEEIFLRFHANCNHLIHFPFGKSCH